MPVLREPSGASTRSDRVRTSIRIVLLVSVVHMQTVLSERSSVERYISGSKGEILRGFARNCEP